MTERQPEFTPTPQQIAEAAAEIRREWSRKEWSRRGGGSRKDLRSVPRLIFRKSVIDGRLK